MTEAKVIARVRLRRGADGYSWILPACPLCGERHIHGGGPLDGDPREYLGCRTAHCATQQPPASYTLIEA